MSVAVPYTGDYHHDVLSGKAALNWNVTPTDMLYLTASRGFKAGGINNAESLFAPEYVWNYEAGVKSTLLDGHAKLQLDAFYMDYSNFQVSQVSPVGGPPSVINTAGATVKGVEGQIQTQWGPARIDATFAYTDSSFRSTSVFNTDSLPFSNFIPSFLLPLPSNFFAANQINIGGHPLDYAPKLTANLGGEYRIALHDGFGSLTPRVQVSYVDSQWAEPYDTPVFDFIPSHTTLDLRLTWEPNDLWRAAVYGTNVTNAVYITGKEFRFATQFYGAPSQYGIRVTRQFD
jgi:iron complex outermembrane receptor protein